ncbi:uncharacterized protein QC761_0013570 [Podospora bellae-mahoneyi]|uniref:Fatty acid desaturase domain-containing protein n=1 Tax=Podospora bellae-mahoneyi TaxID=2093777 RepID=A0ABR0FYZ0_9PEZI|nr:hypothetical protein QC761_0013570 [Podospora bellae-mahoneyi]
MLGEMGHVALGFTSSNPFWWPLTDDQHFYHHRLEEPTESKTVSPAWALGRLMDGLIAGPFLFPGFACLRYTVPGLDSAHPCKISTSSDAIMLLFYRMSQLPAESGAASRQHERRLPRSSCS